MDIEKGKHVHMDIVGPNPVSLHFSTGSKDNAEAIVEKLEKSRALSLPGGGGGVGESALDDEEDEVDEPAQQSRATRKASVHFAGTPTIIPADEEEEEEPEPERVEPTAVVLYDFAADGPDELSVKEGEQVVVLEDDDNDWWKCRNSKNREGVIPASYLEVRYCLEQAVRMSDCYKASSKEGSASTSRAATTAPVVDDDDDDEHEVEERAAAAAAEAEVKAKAKADREAKRDADRKKAEVERRAKEASEIAEARRRQKQLQQEEANKRAASPPTYVSLRSVRL